MPATEREQARRTPGSRGPLTAGIVPKRLSCVGLVAFAVWRLTSTPSKASGVSGRRLMHLRLSMSV